MPGLVVDATGNDLTYRIIGAAMAVHNFLGPGYKEEVYERALAVELRDRGIGVERQFRWSGCAFSPVVMAPSGVWDETTCSNRADGRLHHRGISPGPNVRDAEAILKSRDAPFVSNGSKSNEDNNRWPGGFP